MEPTTTATALPRCPDCTRGQWYLTGHEVPATMQPAPLARAPGVTASLAVTHEAAAYLHCPGKGLPECAGCENLRGRGFDRTRSIDHTAPDCDDDW